MAYNVIIELTEVSAITDLGKFVDAKIAQAKANQVICPECGGVDNGYGTCLCFAEEHSTPCDFCQGEWVGTKTKGRWVGPLATMVCDDCGAHVCDAHGLYDGDKYAEKVYANFTDLTDYTHERIDQMCVQEGRVLNLDG